MDNPVRRSHVRAFSIGAAGLVITLLATHGVGRGQGRGNQPPPSIRAAAPFDPTGYWSSLITQNWRLRMVPPAKGDYIGIPISEAGKKAADAWLELYDRAKKLPSDSAPAWDHEGSGPLRPGSMLASLPEQSSSMPLPGMSIAAGEIARSLSSQSQPLLHR